MNNCKKESLSDIIKCVKVVLLDIEGTTTPIVFVTEVLFPFAKSNVKSYLSVNYDCNETTSIIASLHELCKADTAQCCTSFTFASLDLNEEKESVINAVVEYILWLISNDRKVSPLKDLQGLVWKNGYKSGEIKGDVYDDVFPAIKVWKNSQKKVYIYSSGSVQAQKLLFEHSTCGNMLPLLTVILIQK